jgi:hypothetical protein
METEPTGWFWKPIMFRGKPVVQDGIEYVCIYRRSEGHKARLMFEWVSRYTAEKECDERNKGT